MKCPECQNEMTAGELRLHRSHVAKVLFSPVETGSGGLMASVAPRFVKQLPGQKELEFTGPKGNTCATHGEAFWCSACELLIVK
jgi:hypothetical protein